MIAQANDIDETSCRSRFRLIGFVCFLGLYALISIHPGLAHMRLLHGAYVSASDLFVAVIFLNVFLTAYALWALGLEGLSLGSVFGKERHFRTYIEDISFGLVTGILLIAINIFLSSMLRDPHAKVDGDLAKTSSAYVLECAMYIVVSVCEEIQFRGYVIAFMIDRKVDTVVAVVLQAAIFAVLHGIHQRPSDYLIRFSFGFGFAWVALYRKSIWPAVVAHLVINIAAFVSSVM